MPAGLLEGRQMNYWALGLPGFLGAPIGLRLNAVFNHDSIHKQFGVPREGGLSLDNLMGPR